MLFDPEFWNQLWSNALSELIAWLPRLAGALIILLVGWIIALFVQFILGGILGRLGLDRLVQRAGLDQFLKRANLDSSVVTLISRLVYWLILLVFVLAAAESLGLSRIVVTLQGLVDYLPSVLAAALILLLGGLIARVVGDGVGALAAQTGVSTGPILGQAVRYILMVFVVILSLQQLGIETTLLVTAATALIGALALALALAFGFGSRELARNIMAGFHAKENFTIGQQLAVRDHRGRLLRIGSVKADLETDSGKVSIPNFMLTEEEVTVVPDKPEA